MANLSENPGFNTESESKIDPDKSRALDLFSEFVNEGMGINFGLETRHLQKGVVIKRKSETVFSISIERHPHLFGSGSLGKMSSAFATEIQTFSVDIQARKIDLESEKVKDIEIDYYALVEDDFDYETGDWWLDDNIRERLAKIESEEEVRIFAEEFFPALGLENINETIYVSDYDVPSDFMHNLLETQKEVFIDKVVEEWNRLNDLDDDDWI